MFAIVKSGGKQYRVENGLTIAVERLHGEVGAQVELRDVLMLGAGGAQGETVAGAPLLAEACVRAEIIRQERLPKITVFKKKRRKNYRRTIGHRQQMTWLRIDGIEVPKGLFPHLDKEAKEAKQAAAKPAAVAKKPAAAKSSAEKPAAEKPSAAKPAAAKAKPPAKKPATAKAAVKKAAAKKTVTAKAPAKKATAKKAATKRS